MTTHIRIRSALQPAILDPEARTIHQQLQSAGYHELKDFSKETHYRLAIDCEPEKAREIAEKMARTVLCNPVLHTWSIEIEPLAQVS